MLIMLKEALSSFQRASGQELTIVWLFSIVLNVFTTLGPAVFPEAPLPADSCSPPCKVFGNYTSGESELAGAYTQQQKIIDVSCLGAFVIAAKVLKQRGASSQMQLHFQSTSLVHPP